MRTFIAIIAFVAVGLSGYWAGLNSPQGDHGAHKVECAVDTNAQLKSLLDGRYSAGVSDGLSNRVEGDGQSTYRWVKAEAPR